MLPFLKPVDDGAALGFDRVFHPLETVVDALPARADEVDEQCEIVDARVALGEQVAFEPLEAADCLVHQPPHLGEVARDGNHLLAEALLNRTLDLARERGLELGRRLGQSLDLSAGALERRVGRGGVAPAFGGCSEPLVCPLDRALVHVSQR